jgi:hypothetical protein
MPLIPMTLAIARAVGQDAGNRNAREHGRTDWTGDDYAMAAKTTYRLLYLSGLAPDHVDFDMEETSGKDSG